LENKKIKVGILGPGNIGTDLMYKVMRSPVLEMSVMLGVVDSAGIARAKALGFDTSLEGVQYLEKHPEKADIVFDATTARAHIETNAPVLERLGKIAIDLTPAAIGEMVTPMVNMQDCIQKKLHNANPSPAAARRQRRSYGRSITQCPSSTLRSLLPLRARAQASAPAATLTNTAAPRRALSSTSAERRLRKS